MSDAEHALSALGSFLKSMRQERGLTQAAVADMAGLPRLKVIQVEAGKPGVAASSYARVAAALGGQLQVRPAQRPTLDEIAAVLADEHG